jgi:hypothetical protein
LELQIGPQPIPARIKIPVTIIATIPAAGGSPPTGSPPESKHPHEQTFSALIQPIVTTAPGGISGQRDEPPAELIEAVRLLTLHRMNEKAWDEAASGQIQAAATRMQQLTARLLESGDLALAQHAHQEGQRIARLGTMSLEGHKTLKYGTRALLGQNRQW